MKVSDKVVQDLRTLVEKVNIGLIIYLNGHTSSSKGVFCLQHKKIR